MLLVLFVVLFACGDAVTDGVKRAIELALVAPRHKRSKLVTCATVGWWSAAVP